jgi:hypothetical protein
MDDDTHPTLIRCARMIMQSLRFEFSSRKGALEPLLRVAIVRPGPDDAPLIKVITGKEELSNADQKQHLIEALDACLAEAEAYGYLCVDATDGSVGVSALCLGCNEQKGWVAEIDSSISPPKLDRFLPAHVPQDEELN